MAGFDRLGIGTNEGNGFPRLIVTGSVISSTPPVVALGLFTGKSSSHVGDREARLGDGIAFLDSRVSFGLRDI